jgi:FKBP-type peptidyl-prolyl cis-trans isomerase
VALLSATGCRRGDPEPAPTKADTVQVAAPAAAPAAPAVDPISPEERARRPESRDLVVGNGPVATAGKQINYHYRMRLKSGLVVENSRDRKDAPPRRLELGRGSVLPALEEAMTGMRAGGRRRIMVPSHLAFGHNGVGKQIPPDSDLYFDVEITSVQ